MKRISVIFLLLVCALSGHAQEIIPPMGKSMGRWTGFGLESMKENKTGGWLCRESQNIQDWN